MAKGWGYKSGRVQGTNGRSGKDSGECGGNGQGGEATAAWADQKRKSKAETKAKGRKKGKAEKQMIKRGPWDVLKNALKKKIIIPKEWPIVIIPTSTMPANQQALANHIMDAERYKPKWKTREMMEKALLAQFPPKRKIRIYRGRRMNRLTQRLLKKWRLQ